MCRVARAYLRDTMRRLVEKTVGFNDYFLRLQSRPFNCSIMIARLT